MSESTTAAGSQHRQGLSHDAVVKLFELSVITPTLVVLTAFVASADVQARLVDAIFWTIAIGLVELLPVPGWKSTQVSVALPLFMSVAFLFPPQVSGLVALLASSDPRELKREVRPLRALFNRSQAALAVFSASLVFHSFETPLLSWLALGPAMLAVLVDYLVNTSLVSMAVSLTYRVPVRDVLSKMRIGNPLEFIVSYVGLGFLGVLLGRLFLEVGWWAVAAFVMPLLLARQMFFRTRALEDATQELKDRESVLRALSNRMAEERHDERMQIAGYLHDDMAQLLFRISLHVDILQKQLDAGDGTAAREELDAIRSNKETVSKMLRALIKDLRLSPLGRAGLGEALQTLGQNIEQDWSTRVHLRLVDVDMAPPVQLLCYQLIREALTNAAKHAEASELAVALDPTAEGVRVTISDNGKGFDPEQGSAEGHFGLTLMRERATVAGGTFSLDSAPGVGTTITAEFPTSWLSEDPASAEPGAS